MGIHTDKLFHLSHLYKIINKWTERKLDPDKNQTQVSCIPGECLTSRPPAASLLISVSQSMLLSQEIFIIIIMIIIIIIIMIYCVVGNALQGRIPCT